MVPPSPTHALICLHGFGASGQDFITLHHPLTSILPTQLGQHLALFSPHAPHPTPFGQGYQWFSDNNWTFRDRPGISATKDILWHYLQHLHTTHGIPYAHMVLFGFSQGCMQALYSAPRFPQCLGGVIAHSGCAMYQEELDANTCQKPPILFLHGEDDEVVPADGSVNAAHGLNQLGFTTQLFLLPHLGHGLNAQSLAHISVFLQSLFPQEKTPTTS
jgi:phospholipase/carboxylesterase